VRSTLDSWLVAICAARVLLYANFMVYAACLPVVLVDWQMSAAQAGSVVTGFTLGYAISLVVFSWLADHHGARNVVIVSGLLSAVSAAIFGLLAHSYASALVLYTLAGLSQVGVYTPLIMLFADRYDPARRGAGVGWLIASTSVGYALSLVVSGAALALGGYRLAFIVTGLLPALGAALLWLALRTTPNRIHPRSGGLRLSAILGASPNARRLIAGYTAHSWELLGMWAWIPAFLAASAALSGSSAGAAASSGAYLSAVMHLTGAIAASSMGRLSDRVGRRAVLLTLAAMSAVLSMTIGWLVAWPIYLLLVLGLLYGFAALGDSPVLSVALTEVVEPGYLGVVLALRALLGFGAGAIAPLAFGAVLDLSGPGGATPISWGLAFATLGLGGLIATACAWSVRPGPAPRRSAAADRP
jgi:MFS family permease